MIHVNNGSDPHEWLTPEEFEIRYPELHKLLNPDPQWEVVGRYMSRQRRCKDLTIREMAKRMGWTLTQISDLETGRMNPTDKIIKQWCDSLVSDGGETP